MKKKYFIMPVIHVIIKHKYKNCYAELYASIIQIILLKLLVLNYEIHPVGSRLKYRTLLDTIFL